MISWAIASALMCVVSPAKSAEWQVTSLADGGAGSLRQLLTEAGPGDRIGFAVTGLITLTNGPLVLDKTLTLAGPGPTNLLISGNWSNRVFLVNSNVTALISGVTIRNGKAGDGLMGADGEAGSAGSSGGAIYNLGALTLSNCWVMENVAGNGGTGGRAAVGGAGGLGGGIFNLGNLTLMSCFVSSNASGVGGAGGSAATEQPGKAGGPGGHGGGIFSLGEVQVHDSCLNSNRAGAGGAGSRGYQPQQYPTTFGSGWPGGAGGAGGSGGAVYCTTNCSLSGVRMNANAAGNGGNGGGGGHGWRFGSGGAGGAAGPGGSGGSIYMAGTASIGGATLEANDAGRGGVGGNGGDAGYGSGSPGMGGFGGTGGNGGGMCSVGAVALIACTVSSNRAGHSGLGGMGGNPYLSPSWPREGGSGGGVSGIAALTNCTITGNTSGNGYGGGHGGGCLGPLTLVNCTITGNSSGGPLPEFPALAAYADGGGVTGNALLANTIVALNTDYTGMGDDHVWPDVAGSFTSLGGNLIGNSTGGFGFTSEDLTGVAGAPLDPLLAPLADNGGPTWTRALLPGSPAIDSGRNTAAPNTDQRGLPRIICGAADIGAFEVQGCLKPVFLEIIFLPPTDCSLRCAGAAGQIYTLQVSTNLSAWNALTNLTAGPDGRFQFSEARGTNSVGQWYRLAWP